MSGIERTPGTRGKGPGPRETMDAGASYTLAAATWLGRFYSPVVRADVVERPREAPSGRPTAYIVGDRRMTAEDMIALAEEHGW